MSRTKTAERTEDLAGLLRAEAYRDALAIVRRNASGDYERVG